MAPTVLDGDGGEFQYMAYILGVAHSSGYPLYLLLTKLFTFLPFGDVAFRVNLFSALCGALAVPLIYAVGLRLIGRRLPALLAALIFAVTPTMWGSALETKPYSFHVLLGVLMLLFGLRWHQDGHRRDFYSLTLVSGLGLANHHIIGFTGFAFALLVWFNRARVNWSMLFRGALLILLPLLLYAYIPIRANYFISQQDPANWQLYTREDAILKGTVTAYYINTPDGFIKLVTGLDNSYKLGYESDAERTNRFANALNLLLDQFGFVGIAFAALGAVESFRRDRRVFAFLFLYTAGVAFIALYMRARSTVYYFSLAYFIFALFIGFAIDALMQWFKRFHRTIPYAIAFAIFLIPIVFVVMNYARFDESNNYEPRDYAQAVLRDNLPPNAVVIAPWEVSQPLRYFQFVENQRPDLLITDVSPTTKQFATMLTNARKLNRPFYSVEFTPEVKTPGQPRSVEVVPLPLLQEPQPRYALRDQKIVPEVSVLGYDLDPDPPQPGKPMRVLVYYRASSRMYPMYSAALHSSDITGKPWATVTGFPGSAYFPTYRWYELGEYYRDAWTINLPADAPAGLYHLDLSWYVYDLEAHKPDLDKEFKVSLGTIRVGDLLAIDISHPQTARVGDAITFLGWSGDSSVARGQSLNVDLFWRTERSLSESYTVFVHLADSTGRVIADADSPSSTGLFPTDRWTPGEGVRDRHVLKIPADLAPGNYVLEIGMYLPTTGARLPIGADDKIILTQLNVH